MNLIKKFSLLLILLISLSANAYKTITLDGDNRDYKCNYRSTLLKGVASPSLLPKLIENLNLSVDCLASDQRHFIINSDLSIRGITFGTHASVSKVVSIEGGAELVITIFDNQTLMIGLVRYKGGGASVSLPIGASITKGALHGECKTIDNYLGNYQTFSLLGMNKSYGTANEIRNPHRTFCDSSSNTLGASMSLLGYSMTNYKRGSEFFYLKGHRVEELIEFITRYHPLE